MADCAAKLSAHSTLATRLLFMHQAVQSSAIALASDDVQDGSAL